MPEKKWLIGDPSSSLWSFKRESISDRRVVECRIWVSFGFKIAAYTSRRFLRVAFFICIWGIGRHRIALENQEVVQLQDPIAMEYLTLYSSEKCIFVMSTATLATNANNFATYSSFGSIMALPVAYPWSGRIALGSHHGVSSWQMTSERVIHH